MDTIKNLLIKYKGVILYLIFGVLTTVINVAAYYVSYDICGISNLVSTMIAWVIAVAFAFITNKLIVFESKKWDKDSIKEVFNFILCRVGTGVIEVGFMYVFVDLLSFNGTIMKLITNFIVIVINYIASKLIIFKSKKDDNGDKK